MAEPQLGAIQEDGGGGGQGKKGGKKERKVKSHSNAENVLGDQQGVPDRVSSDSPPNGLWFAIMQVIPASSVREKPKPTLCIISQEDLHHRVDCQISPVQPDR